jgi:hypothetical protein
MVEGNVAVMNTVVHVLSEERFADVSPVNECSVRREYDGFEHCKCMFRSQ